MNIKLNISNAERKMIEETFSNWSDHFKAELKSSGVDYLIKKYSDLVDEVKKGYDWEDFEYDNDISVRKALHKILKILSGENRTILFDEVNRLDNEMKPHLRVRSKNEKLGAEYLKNFPEDEYWWEHFYPQTIDER